jgi:hypothetical protein
MASFGGIKRDCDSIVGELKTQLKSKLCNDASSPAEMSECVNLLLQLDEPADVLCQDFLDTSGRRLDESVAALEKQVVLVSNGGGLMKQHQVWSVCYCILYIPSIKEMKLNYLDFSLV